MKGIKKDCQGVFMIISYSPFVSMCVLLEGIILLPICRACISWPTEPIMSTTSCTYFKLKFQSSFWDSMLVEKQTVKQTGDRQHVKPDYNITMPYTCGNCWKELLCICLLRDNLFWNTTKGNDDLQAAWLAHFYHNSSWQAIEAVS